MSFNGLVTLMMSAYRIQGRLLGREAARSHLSEQSGRLNPFTLVHLQPVGCSDGVALCCSCRNAGCGRSDQARELFKRELMFPDQSQEVRGHLWC